jgi:hypothetical protein
MITLLASLAYAAPSPIALEWARPFVLAAPETWTWRSDRMRYTEGYVLQLRVDPAKAAPTQTKAPVLFVGDQPVFRFNWDATGGCAVVIVPGHLDLTAVAPFWGSDVLPERVTPEAAKAEVDAAREAGATPFAKAQVDAALNAGGPALQAKSFDDVNGIAMARVRACTATPSDAKRGQ